MAKWQKSRPHRRKKLKIDISEITGCTQIQEIERPEVHYENVLFCTVFAQQENNCGPKVSFICNPG
jgi:hypothetical protein